MDTIIDDIGSFPLPNQVNRQVFNRAYCLARQAIIDGNDVRKDEFLHGSFYKIVLDSFVKKCKTGLEVINYPQHYDMHDQFAWAIREAMDRGTYVADEKNAIIPEVFAIGQEARRLSEELGRKLRLRICITGPLELYLRIIGTSAHKDVLLMFAETVKRFAKNSILDSKYIKTEVASLDEPSFGFQEPSIDKDALVDVLEKAFDFNGVTKQIHLHSPLRVSDLFGVSHIDVLSFEYAGSPRNVEGLSKNALDKAGKQVRIGIARTDIDSITAELHDKGMTTPNADQLVESKENIQKRFGKVKDKYGDRMTFTGPDCGLGGWPSQEAAELLLKRVVEAVKGAECRTT
jgi:5-methyltetrahydropteroyltriglutamate--homocysteine methyltransferase